MANKLGEAFVVIKGDLNPLKKSLRKARALTSRFLGKVGELAKKGIGFAFSFVVNLVKGLINLIKKLAKVAAIAFVAITGLVIKIGASFEKVMARVRALTGATAMQFAQLENAAKRFGETTVFTANEVGQAMSFLALAGFKTNKIIASMPATLNLAAAGQLELSRAADITAKIMAGMGLEVDELNGAVDVLAKAFTTANTDLSQLGEALKFVGPVGRASGKKLEELVSVIQLLSNVGIQSTMAGTSLRGILSRLSGAVPSVSKTLKKMGITIKDAAGKMLPLADIIDDLNDKMKDLQQADKTARIMQLFGLRAGPAMAALLLEGGDALRVFEARLQDAGGTAERIAKIQLNTLAGKWKILQSILSGVALEIWTNLRPKIKGLIDVIAKWTTDNKTNIVKWAETVQKNILMVIASIVNNKDKIFETVSIWKKSIDDWADSLGGIEGIWLNHIFPAIQKVALFIKNDLIPTLQSLKPLLELAVGAAKVVGVVAKVGEKASRLSPVRQAKNLLGAKRDLEIAQQISEQRKLRELTELELIVLKDIRTRLNGGVVGGIQ